MSPKYVQDFEGYWHSVQDFREDLSISDVIRDCVAKNIEDLGLDLNEAYARCRSGIDFYSMPPEAILDMFIGDAVSLPPVPNAPGAAVGGQNVRPMRTIAEAVRAAGSPAGAGTKSSNIEKIGYFNSMLEVEFKGGRRYVYFVGPEMYERFVKAPSKGKFLWEVLRGKEPGLVFDDPNKITPGGVPFSGGKGGIVPYSKGSGGTPEISTLRPQAPDQPSIPDAKQQALLRKELEIQFRGKGLKYPKIAESLPSTDFTMHGFITRSGEFNYGSQGVKTKKWKNLKKLFKSTGHFPIFGKKSYGSHGESYETLIGYTHDWEFFEPGEIDKDGHIYSKQELFEDIHNLSDLKDPSKLPVSLGFIDLGEGKYQKISKLRHLAVSLNKLEGDRCSSEGGLGCNISILDNSIPKGKDSKFSPNKADYLKLNKGETIMGEEEKEDMYESGKAENADRSREDQFKENCHANHKSSESCDIAWDAVKGGGGVAEKKVKTQDPSKYNSKGDMTIPMEEYADLMAAARLWKESKEYIDDLRKADEVRKEKEADELRDYLLNERHVDEDFVKEYGKTLCDLKIMKGTLSNLPKTAEDMEHIQEINNQRILNQVGDKVDDFAKLEEEYKQDALNDFFPQKA